MQYLFRSFDRGDNWERISPDLTYNNPDEQGDISFATITTISESPLRFGLIFVGTDDGKIHVTRDGGHHWNEIMKGLPYKKWVSRLVASAYDESTVYLSMNGKRDNDFTDYLYRSTDYGRTWTDISANLPGGPINVIREDPGRSDMLYVGTDLGVYVSMDSGLTWQVLATGFPTTFVHDLAVHPRDNLLVAATHGRGMWILDVKYMQKCTPEVMDETVFLFDPEPVTLPSPRRWWEPKPAAEFVFYTHREDTAYVTVSDSAGNTVMKDEKPVRAGLNKFEWNVEIQDKAGAEGETPYATPGTYTVSLSVGGAIREKPLEIRKSGRE
jgi:hypothetical protein